MVPANIGRVRIVYFAHLEDTSCLVVLGPEVLGDFLDGVDANAVEVVDLHDVLDPAEQVGPNERMRLVKVWQAPSPAVFHLPLVVPVDD